MHVFGKGLDIKQEIDSCQNLDEFFGLWVDGEWLYISHLGFSLLSIMDDYHYPDSILYFFIYVALYAIGAGILFAITLHRMRQPAKD